MRSNRCNGFSRQVLSLAFVFALAFGAVGRAAAAAPVIYVRAAHWGAGNGTSWSNAYGDLQQALAVASAGQEIWVAAGVYLPSLPFLTGDPAPRQHSFLIPSGVGVYGGFAGTETQRSQRNVSANPTILSGNVGDANVNSDNDYHVVTLSGVSSATVLDGFTITEGNANGSLFLGEGGGIYSTFSAARLANLTIVNNSAALAGGGMADIEGVEALNNVLFLDNSSPGASGSNGWGGGMYLTVGAKPAFNNVVFRHNSAIYGGAAYLYGSGPAISGIVFEGNTASIDGGGLLVDGLASNPKPSPTLISLSFNGNEASEGGGLAIRNGAAPIITNCTFTGNLATQGGGAYVTNSDATLSGVTFQGNWASSGGGGISMENAGHVSLANTILAGNRAQFGGGLSTALSSPVLTNVAFLGNAAISNALISIEGGGMLAYGGSPVLMNVTFSDNTSPTGQGGGFYVSSSAPLLQNVTFNNNSALTGGGLYATGTSPATLLNNLTISGNSATTSGSGLYSDAALKLTNSILWGNTSTQTAGPGALTIQDSILQGSCPPGGTCNHVLNQDPKLGVLKNNGGFTQTMSPGMGSAAIDAGGTLASCEPKDQRGVVRPQGGACDMGAYEVKASRFVSNGAEDGFVTAAGIPDSGSAALRVGDDASNQQLRGFLSFNTATLPDHAVVVLSKLILKKQAVSGNPFAGHGKLLIDLKKPFFGNAAGLESLDFASPSTLASAGSITSTLSNGAYLGSLTPAALTKINKVGDTQLRLRFAIATDNDHLADALSLFSGNAAAAKRPVLWVYYNP